ncbi:hypothetical protein BDR07DRAFT_1493675 [Suillus spraguei]|nr:hypothetical protein BDR07DRAFT_1493675 [Suillus spraguei]
MTTSTSFRGAVDLQNGSIDKKNFWRYAGFIATPEIVDIRFDAFTVCANTASAEVASIYWSRRFPNAYICHRSTAKQRSMTW